MKQILLILVCLATENGFAQDRRLPGDNRYAPLLDKGLQVTNLQVQQAKSLLEDIEAGIAEGDISSFSKHFDKQVFVNITKGESGYFSSNQTSSLLHHYVASRKIVSFKFSRVSEKGISPYATGRLVTLYRGSQESAQVYVSCSWQDSRWVIGQFNIY
jgi:hypothetical protein